MEKCGIVEGYQFVAALGLILGMAVVAALILPVFFEIGDTIKYVVARKLREYYD